MSGDAASLTRLHDILTPPPVPWWPPAKGWYVLAALLLILTVLGLLRWWRHRGAEFYRHQALAEIRALQTLSAQPQQRAEALAALSGLLKRTALAAYPRHRVAALSGPAWWRFLDESAGMKEFSDGIGELLEKIVHGAAPADAADAERLADGFAAASRWVRQHRRAEG